MLCAALSAGYCISIRGRSGTAESECNLLRKPPDIALGSGVSYDTGPLSQAMTIAWGRSRAPSLVKIRLTWV